MNALDSDIQQFYEAIRKHAHYLMRGERAGHSLDTSALVSSAFIRLGEEDFTLGNVGLVVLTMRRILIDHAKKKATAKRKHVKVANFDLNSTAISDCENDPLLHISIYNCFEKMEEGEFTGGDCKRGKAWADALRLRWYIGCSQQECADQLNIPLGTIGDYWAKGAKLVRAALANSGYSLPAAAPPQERRPTLRRSNETE